MAEQEREPETIIHEDQPEKAPVAMLQGASVFIQEILILSGVNFSLHHGEFKYLIGRTGSGKSSLIKTLYGELPLRVGSGEVAGYDLSRLRSKQIPYLRRKLGIVFQDFHLLMDRDIRDNLKFVLRATGWRDKRKMEERMDQVLERVGLKNKGFKRPHQLSGGEQQRLVIARALLNDPSIILADEPTGNLDPETSDEIMGLLTEINQRGRAILMATHNYSLIRKFPAPIVRCENSGVIEVSALDA